ncbi:MAG TPA: metalloregulator ArsR/SmtB family transcription factor [Ktedonobacteraceae bacterium]|nr:metalloregulator ArsR/SmtB family transcription factor [Ktedonobacteraceae bacterium]
MDEWKDLKGAVKALAGVARLSMVYHLAKHNEMTVTSLADLLELSQPLVSWHLRKLRRAGLAETRRVGRQVYCSLNKEYFLLCLQRLERLVDPAVQIETFPVGAELMEAEVSSEN